MRRSNITLECRVGGVACCPADCGGEHPSGCKPPAGPPRWAQHCTSCHVSKIFGSASIRTEATFVNNNFEIWCVELRTTSDARSLISIRKSTKSVIQYQKMWSNAKTLVQVVLSPNIFPEVELRTQPNWHTELHFKQYSPKSEMSMFDVKLKSPSQRISFLRRPM